MKQEIKLGLFFLILISISCNENSGFSSDDCIDHVETSKKYFRDFDMYNLKGIELLDSNEICYPFVALKKTKKSIELSLVKSKSQSCQLEIAEFIDHYRYYYVERDLNIFYHHIFLIANKQVLNYVISSESDTSIVNGNLVGVTFDTEEFTTEYGLFPIPFSHSDLVLDFPIETLDSLSISSVNEIKKSLITPNFIKEEIALNYPNSVYKEVNKNYIRYWDLSLYPNVFKYCSLINLKEIYK